MIALEHARAFLDGLPPAISGAGKHDRTFCAACGLVRLGLLDQEAMTLLREYNGRCQPPWNESELAHKLRDARIKAGGQVRKFVNVKPSVRVVWKLQREPQTVATATPTPSAVAACTAGPPPLLLPADQTAWLPVVQQILTGKFDGADESTVESLTIGLRSIQHAFCQRALARLLANPEKPKKR